MAGWFRKAAKEVGLGERMALGRLREMCDRFIPALSAGAEKLAAEGYENAFDIKERILQKGGICHLKRLL